MRVQTELWQKRRQGTYGHIAMTFMCILDYDSDKMSIYSFTWLRSWGPEQHAGSGCSVDWLNDCED